MVSTDISNMLLILLCASLFFSNYSHHECEWVCRKCANSLATINIVCVREFCGLHTKKKKKGNIKRIIHKIKNLPWGKSGRLLLNQELLERKDAISCFRPWTLSPCRHDWRRQKDNSTSHCYCLKLVWKEAFMPFDGNACWLLFWKHLCADKRNPHLNPTSCSV